MMWSSHPISSIQWSVNYATSFNTTLTVFHFISTHFWLTKKMPRSTYDGFSSGFLNIWLHMNQICDLCWISSRLILVPVTSELIWLIYWGMDVGNVVITVLNRQDDAGRNVATKTCIIRKISQFWIILDQDNISTYAAGIWVETSLTNA